MAIPSSYTESTLRDYMLSITANVAGAVGWVAVDFTEAVNDALVTYGVDDIADATDIEQLRALAKVEAWRALADATASDFNFSADGGTYNRSQLHDHAVKAFSRAEGEAAQRGYGVSVPAITLGEIKHQDPYLTDETLYD